MTREQWQAIKQHSTGPDASFFYALKRSKTVCRPSCTRRKVQPRDVIIFDTLEEALQQGYRVCSSCRPDVSGWKGPKWELACSAEQLIREHYEEKFSLAALAEALHVDKSYLLRTFRQMKGTTLLAFHNKVRCEAAKELLTRPELSVSYIAQAVGFVSPAHFSKIFRQQTGSSPSEYRSAYLESLDR